VDAQQARRVLTVSWAKISLLLWERVAGLSAGRQSVAVRLICVTREIGLRASGVRPPRTAALPPGPSPRSGRRPARRSSRPPAETRPSWPSGRDVGQGGRSGERRKNLSPPSLPTLRDARGLRFSASRTDGRPAAHEGVEIDNGAVGLITYMRTLFSGGRGGPGRRLRRDRRPAWAETLPDRPPGSTRPEVGQRLTRRSALASIAR
jgi:hypothetical protein